MEEYLFRIDMATDNDLYLEAHREEKVAVYAGLDFRVGIDNWIPDFVRVGIDETTETASVVLVELEARAGNARVSARKYLAEDSGAILKAFDDYLGRVISSCKNRADPREQRFRTLRKRLQITGIRLYAAGALRTERDDLECHPLLYQVDGRIAALNSPPRQRSEEIDGTSLFGRSRLGASELKWLSRTISVVDAVIRGKDSSIAQYRSWRAQPRSQPLKVYLKYRRSDYPVLTEFTFGRKLEGGGVDAEALCQELSHLWSEALDRSVGADEVKRLLNQYSIEASTIKGHDRMPQIFDKARAVIAGNDI